MTQEMTSRHSVGPLIRALYSPTKCNQPSSAQLGLARPGSASLGLARPGLGLARLGYITSLQARGSCLFTRPGLGLDSAWPRLGLGLASAWLGQIWPDRGQAAGLPYLLDGHSRTRKGKAAILISIKRNSKSSLII